jgi:hypothetical protein
MAPRAMMTTTTKAALRRSATMVRSVKCASCSADSGPRPSDELSEAA